MADRWSDEQLGARLHELWTAELARAQEDYAALPVRPSIRMQVALPAGILVLVAVVLGFAILLHPFAGGPPVGDQGIQLGSDGLPVAIGGQPVLRGTQITVRLAEGPATPFLAGGRLVVAGGLGCPVPVPEISSGCTETWRLESVDGSGPVFTLDNVTSVSGFVHTAGALTLVRVQAVRRAACGSAPCPNEVSASGIAWRQPTTGSVPPNGFSADGGQVYDAVWPDFVPTYGRDGVTIAGYIAKGDLVPYGAYVPGSPANPRNYSPLPVYGADLTTLIGYKVPGVGFVPLDQYTPPSPTTPVTPEPLGSPMSSAPDARVVCGSVGRTFPFSALNNPTGAEQQSGPLYDALRAGFGMFGGSEDVSGLSWLLAQQDDSGALFLARAGSQSPDWRYVLVTYDGGYRPGSVGKCNLTVQISKDFGLAHWALDPAYPAPDAASTELHLLVWEFACSSGSPTTGRMSAPLVEYAPDSVTITIGVRPLTGNVTCQGVRGTPATVTLPQPLGNRTLLDGYRYPAVPPSPMP